MSQKEDLKEKIIDRIRTLDAQTLESLETFITSLEAKRQTVEEVLSFAGAWKDWDGESFLEVTNKKRRHTDRDS